MKNSLLAIFAKIHCTTLYIQGDLSNFGATLKIRKKSKFDHNQLKFSMQHKNIYVYQKK